MIATIIIKIRILGSLLIVLLVNLITINIAATLI